MNQTKIGAVLVINFSQGFQHLWSLGWTFGVSPVVEQKKYCWFEANAAFTITPQQIPAVFGGCKIYPGHGTKNLRGWKKMSFKVSSYQSMTLWKAARKKTAPVNLDCDLWAWLAYLVLFLLTCALWCFIEKFNQNPRFLSFIPKLWPKLLKNFQNSCWGLFCFFQLTLSTLQI